MAGRRQSTPEPTEPVKRRGRPAATPEAREQELIMLAFDLVEKKLRDGTASSQETTHLLKLGSSREMVEQERIRAQVALDKAKIDSMAQAQNIENLMNEAMAAMQRYSPERPPDREFDD